MYPYYYLIVPFAAAVHVVMSAARLCSMYVSHCCSGCIWHQCCDGRAYAKYGLGAWLVSRAVWPTAIQITTYDTPGSTSAYYRAPSVDLLTRCR